MAAMAIGPSFSPMGWVGEFFAATLFCVWGGNKPEQWSFAHTVREQALSLLFLDAGVELVAAPLHQRLGGLIHLSSCAVRQPE